MTDWHKIEWDVTYSGSYTRERIEDIAAMDPASEPVRTITTTGHQSLLMPYYGQSIPHGVDQPIGTVTTRDRHALINAEAIVDDCGFRMLEPYESAAAMAFAPDYIPRTLAKKHQMRLAGNAVCPPNMEWVAGRVIDWLATV